MLLNPQPQTFATKTRKKMALQSQFLSSFTTNTNVGRSVLWLCSPQPSLTIRSQKASSESSKSNLEDPTPLSSSAPPKKPGVGFGSSNSNATAAAAEASSASTSSSKRKQQKKGRRERASIIRRTPLEKPPFVSEQEKGIAKEQTKNESAFLLAWLGFGAIILVEGITLAASGLLPEEWDKFFVKYLYPSFTPTVFLFVAGAVAYGVYKYLQNEKITKQK